MDIPIVFIHFGMSRYLLYTLAQARISNPSCPIILLGDDNNASISFVEHVNMKSFMHVANAFNQCYFHRSPNGESLERFCFVRWFLIREFIARAGITKCLHLDSDILLYAKATEEQSRLAQYNFTLSSSRSPHCCFINSADALHEYCERVLRTYSSQEGRTWVLKEFDRINTVSSGGVCDMTFFEAYSHAFPGSCAELTDIVADSVYDDNINVADGFAMQDGIKAVRFLDHRPIGHHMKSNKDVWFKTLHFQGYETKRRIEAHVQYYS